MMRTSSATTLVLALVASACTEAGETTVLLDVTYSSTLAPEAFRMTANGVSELGPPAHTVRVVVPDEWSGTSITIALDAMSGGASVARGETALTPVTGEEVRGSIVLEKPDCPQRCAPGSTRCESNGVSTCELDLDNCTYWQEPLACDAATPFCSNGHCSDQCEDECTTGATRCSGNAVQTCGESDSDTCSDWSTPTACGAGETCSNGSCASTCADECSAGAKRCGGNGVETCGDFDGDDCLDWSSPATCNQPPASVCVNASTVRTFAVSGTCNATSFACDYTATEATCAGGCSNGQCAGSAADVVASGDTSCQRRLDGTVECWGRNVTSLLSEPSGAFTQLSAGTSPNNTGQNHVCGLRANGTVACWGYTTYGVTTVPAGTYTAVSSGGYHACGLRTNGTVKCWGYTWEYSGSGMDVSPPGTYVALTSGGDNMCGLSAAGVASCFGYNVNGANNVPAGLTFKSLDAGGGHVCGIKTDDTITCWGANSRGQLSAPTGTFTKLDAGGFHTCGIRTNGTLACWGSNDAGEATPPSGTFISIAAGEDHSCGVRTNNQVVCWGSNIHGQLNVP